MGRREKDQENCQTDGKGGDGAEKTSPKTQTASGEAYRRKGEGCRRGVRVSGFVDREQVARAVFSQRLNILASPWACYSINCGTQLLFLLLFSYVLLFDRIESGPPSAFFIALIIWVFDIMCEEIRQVFTENRADRGGATASDTVVPVKHRVMKQVRVYFQDEWNILDIICLGCFALGVGMVVFCNNQVVQRMGRVLLSVDIICFFLRFLQVYMVYHRIGLLVAMLPKLWTDAYQFMFILLVFVMSYAVASESLLFSRSLQFPVHLSMVFYRAFFQLFGELDLDHINGDDCENCTQKDQYPECPAEFQSRTVTVMLGVYLIFTNILLLNLLIARFSATFTEVMEQAEEYRSWHNWQLLREFYNRSLIEVWPALNIITFIPPFRVITLCLLAPLWLFSSCRKRRNRADPSASGGRITVIIDKSGYQRCVTIKWPDALTTSAASATSSITAASPSTSGVPPVVPPSNTGPNPSTSRDTPSNTGPTPSTSGATPSNTAGNEVTEDDENTTLLKTTADNTAAPHRWFCFCRRCCAAKSTSGDTPNNTIARVHIKIYDECMRHREEVKFKVARQTSESTGWQELTYWRSDPRHFITANICGIYKQEEDEMDKDTDDFLAFQLKCVAMREAQDFESQQARWVRQMEEKDVKLSHVLDVTKSHKDVTQKMQASMQDIAWRQHEQATKMEGKMDKRLEEMSQQLTTLLKTIQPAADPPETRSE